MTDVVIAVDADEAETPLVRREVPTPRRNGRCEPMVEVMVAAKRLAAERRVVEITSDFPALDYSSLPDDADNGRRQHDPRWSS